MEFIVSISGLTRSTILKHGNRSPHARSVLRECATPADIAPVAGFFPTELARRAGLTHTTVAAIEKGRIDPSLGTLKRLLEACGVSMSEFFRNENNASIVTEAHRINTVSTGGVHMLPGAVGAGQAASDHPGNLRRGRRYRHQAAAARGAGRGIVIRGVFELQLGDERYTLRPGDSYYFDSTTPHRLRNIGEEQGEIINAASPPSF